MSSTVNLHQLELTTLCWNIDMFGSVSLHRFRKDSLLRDFRPPPSLFSLFSLKPLPLRFNEVCEEENGETLPIRDIRVRILRMKFGFIRCLR